jgi:hypothetical protein
VVSSVDGSFFGGCDAVGEDMKILLDVEFGREVEPAC